MKKFDLWFPKPMRHGFDEEAETVMVCGQSSYIELVNPFDDGSGQHNLVKSKGHILLCNEATSAEECCRQIDRLILDLQSLKAKARKKFVR